MTTRTTSKDINDEGNQKSPNNIHLQQKIVAVFSIWCERRTTGKMCQEINISPALLGLWQILAIEGMLRALDPKKKDPLPPIDHRLSRLFEKVLVDSGGKLEKWLKTIQKAKQSSAR